MDLDAQQKVSPYLAAGERLLWAGRPGQGLIFRSYDLFLIPFSLIWGGMAIFILVQLFTAKGGHAGLPAYFIPPLFVLFGLYLMFGRFFVDKYQRSKTYYGLTDQRAVIVSGVVSQSSKSFNLKATGEIGFRLRADGTGTITFGESSPLSYMRITGKPGMGGSIAPSFERIVNAKEVYEMIQRITQGR